MVKNPVAKFSHKFNKAKVEKDKKRELKKGKKVKHKLSELGELL